MKYNEKKITVFLAVICTMIMSGCDISNITNIISHETSQAQNIVDEYLLPSNTKEITEVDLSKLNDIEIKYAYEEIFARHGKIYDDEDFKKYFDTKK